MLILQEANIISLSGCSWYLNIGNCYDSHAQWLLRLPMWLTQLLTRDMPHSTSNDVPGNILSWETTPSDKCSNWLFVIITSHCGFVRVLDSSIGKLWVIPLANWSMLFFSLLAKLQRNRTQHYCKKLDVGRRFWYFALDIKGQRL